MKVFFDTSTVLSGLKSATGGSKVLLLLSEKGKITPVISELVLKEVKRNIEKKFSEDELLSFISWIKKAKPKTVLINQGETSVYKAFVPLKDTHVLAAANKAKVKYLVTLDKKHLLKLGEEKVNFPFKIVTPGELINLL